MSDHGDFKDKQPIKRKRVTKACLVCAKSRRKCDGQQPLCGTCKTQGLACTWSDVPSRRGPPKGYRRGTADPMSLMPKIAKIREHIQALQVAYGERFVLDELHKALYEDCSCGAGAASSDGHAGLSMSETTAGAGSGTASDSSGNGARRAKSEWSQDEQDDPTNSDIDEGSSSGMAFLATSMRYMHTGTSPLSPISDSERPGVEKYNPWALRNDRLERHSLIRRRSATSANATQPSPAEVEHLLKIYWSSIHPHWPILYKPAFDAVSIFSIYEEVPLALLYALFSLSARLASTTVLDAQMAEVFRSTAEEKLLSEGVFRSNIDTCTALFLLSLYYHGEGNQRQAWVHCSVAATMALDLGLHKSVKNLPLVDHERRVRVFWNIFVYEKNLACEMGRPVMIRMVHCDPARLSEEQSDEYETVVHPGTSRFGHTVRLYTISIFNSAVDLFRIFERILSEVHSVPKPSSNRSARERLVQELEYDLDKWQKSLGPRCTYPRPDDRQPTRTLYLTHAWYHVAIILLHRPLIHRPRVGQNFVSNVHHKKATDHANQLVDLLAQFAVGQEIEKLPPNDAYLIFTAANLHVFNLTLSDKSLREAARPRLEQCIEWLRGLAETWSAASQYKLLLDAFSQVATNTISHSHSLSPTAVSPSSSTPHAQTPHPQAATHVAYPSQSGIPYILPPNTDHIPDSSVSVTSATPSITQQQQHPQQQQIYTGETEQKFLTPEQFSLETYYWNDFQTGVNVGHQIGGYYPQAHNNEIATHVPGGVYYDVLRLLQEEGRAS
ncbi:fungal-specific transcription factor domain-containing protein [Phellopilus nigrolimitatus]|nr:fungal-specific transcription factor domain-containing protein [Phellopilus nigrolimitatus]